MIIRLDEIDSRAAYRLLTSLVVPRPIAWVTTINEDGTVNAAPFSFFNGVTGRPPMIAISVATRRGEEKDTARNVERTGAFVVNLVDEAAAEAMNRTATEFPYGTSEPDEVGLDLLPGSAVDVPGIATSPAALECACEQIIRVGDPPVAHIIGRVLAYRLQDRLRWDPEEGILPEDIRLIGRMGQSRYVRTRDVFTMERIPYEPSES